MTNTQSTPGIYQKGDVKKTALRASQAVALEFEGYKRVADLPKPKKAAPAKAVPAEAAPKVDEK